MKILHTADWHLGHKFKQNYDRIEEHRKVMDWLLSVIEKECIDILIVAGDIFDVRTPPNNARELYYNFLKDANKKGCRHIIIVGGNHDSPSMLNAPKEILSVIKTHVVGCFSGHIEDEIITLYNDEKELEAVIAAVPFLRERDLKSGVVGEDREDRITKIKEGIKKHYQDAADIIKKYEDENVPLIATGHLYARGATASSNQNNIYIGNMENISADHFPSTFDYVALGHIHQPQIIGKQNHIRYSGSLIPMNFGEWRDEKSVTIVEFEGKEIKHIELLPVPAPRKLVSIKGKENQVEEQLKAIIQEVENSPHLLEAWVEILISSEETRPDIVSYYNEMVGETAVRILRVSYHRQQVALDALSSSAELDDLTPMDIFEKKCDAVGMNENARKKAKETFQELLIWMKEYSI